MGPTSMSPSEIGSLATQLKQGLHKTKQTITRKGSFDSGHRVMNERMKCFNLHGHTYLYELEFSFTSIYEIGYNIDFKEIKRVACQWIEDKLDHGMIINPEDRHVIEMSDQLDSKKWIMSLNGEGKYCNPTVENIAKEIFLAIDYLMRDEDLRLESVTVYETPNCFTKCDAYSVSRAEELNFIKKNAEDLKAYKEEKGKVEYDDRKCNA